MRMSDEERGIVVKNAKGLPLAKFIKSKAMEEPRVEMLERIISGCGGEADFVTRLMRKSRTFGVADFLKWLSDDVAVPKKIENGDGYELVPVTDDHL